MRYRLFRVRGRLLDDVLVVIGSFAAALVLAANDAHDAYDSYADTEEPIVPTFPFPRSS